MRSLKMVFTAFRPRPRRCRGARPAQWARHYRLGAIVGALIASTLGLALAPGRAFASRAVPPVGQQPRMAEIVVKAEDFGTISKNLFGTNLLWADDAEGAFDPVTGNFYPGFVSLLRGLGVTAIRYPAGTTSDSFDWQRAIGPGPARLPNEPYGMQAARLSKVCCVLDGPQASTVGPDELGKLLDETGAIGTITVNFATGTAQEAADFVAYMTAPLRGPSSSPADPGYWAALRARNGHPAPYDVPYWEVGNEQSFPGQYGWRSGRLVSFGPGAGSCPPGHVPTCLYAFGGTTAFFGQPVGTFADELPAASYSTGRPGQTFYAYFPPVVPASATVYVDGQPWSETDDLAAAAPGAQVYALDPATGAITFGDGVHGEVPPAGSKITVSYESGPHGGFVEFYRAMKAMGQHVHVCESEEANVAFLRLMGRQYPYDCVELHEYAAPTDVDAPLWRYEEELLGAPEKEGAALARLERDIRRYSGRDVPVVLTEYGQLIAPVPAEDPQFNLSLDEGLLVGAQLVEWADHGVPLAEKYLAVSVPFAPGGTTTLLSMKRLRLVSLRRLERSMVESGMSVDNALIARQGQAFVAEPPGEVLGLMSRLGGSELVFATALDDPRMGTGAGVPELWVTAGLSRQKSLELVVINADPLASVRAEVLLDGLTGTGQAEAYVLDGPSPASYNTVAAPGQVTVTPTTVDVGVHVFSWDFPAHSVTLLELVTSSAGYLVSHLQGRGSARPGPGGGHAIR